MPSLQRVLDRQTVAIPGNFPADAKRERKLDCTNLLAALESIRCDGKPDARNVSQRTVGIDPTCRGPLAILPCLTNV
ncbi:hypothetical protein SV7mr_22750 [Stieleria bergensis]|uniref:Uncharacterized protein n=1 Tax=Stieleria bergensis TaxID=2528025 RepID=A0A517SUF0_9BACT|nr:hypothetical protein SV7mr_22750 [Planctomycetes bacterium SV_7m_r]